MKADSGLLASLSAACNRAISSCAAIRSLLYVFLICCGHRRIKFDQDITGLHVLSVVHTDGPDDADFERLDQLNPTTWDNFTVRIGDDVDMTHARPDEPQTKQRYDGCANRPANRRWRGLNDFQRCGQEREFFLFASLASPGTR